MAHQPNSPPPGQLTNAQLLHRILVQLERIGNHLENITYALAPSQPFQAWEIEERLGLPHLIGAAQCPLAKPPKKT